MATAWQLFYRDGYRVVGIDTILAKAEVAKMTLYKHFPSKEDLIVAVIEKRSGEVLNVLTAAVEAAGRSPARRLLAVFDALRTWFESDDFKGCAFIRALSEYPDTDHPIHQAAWRHKCAVRALLAELAAAAEVDDPKALADELALLVDGAIIRAHATGSATSADSAKSAANALLKLAAA